VRYCQYELWYARRLRETRWALVKGGASVAFAPQISTETFLSRRCGKPASEQHFGVERSWHDLRREVANKNCTPLIC
jgi:hypothetical protein